MPVFPATDGATGSSAGCSPRPHKPLLSTAPPNLTCTSPPLFVFLRFQTRVTFPYLLTGPSCWRLLGQCERSLGALSHFFDDALLGHLLCSLVPLTVDSSGVEA